MSGKLKNFIGDLKTYGLDHIFRVISWRLPRWLFYYDRSIHHKLGQVPIADISRAGYEIRVAKLEDYPLMNPMAIGEDIFKMRLERGDTCVIAVRDNLVAAMAWGASGNLFIKNTGAVLDTGADGFYIYNAYTLVEDRRRGLYTALHDLLRQHYHANNKTNEFNSIDVYNQHSYQLHMKLGYKKIGITVYFCLFGINFCFYSDWLTGKKSRTDIFIRKSPEIYEYV